MLNRYDHIALGLHNSSSSRLKFYAISKTMFQAQRKNHANEHYYRQIEPKRPFRLRCDGYSGNVR